MKSLLVLRVDPFLQASHCVCIICTYVCVMWACSYCPFSKAALWFVLLSLLQSAEIPMEEGMHHFAVSGRGFAVITEHFPQLLQKVQTQTRPSWCLGMSAFILLWYSSVFSPHGGAAARTKSHCVCSHGSRPEDSAGGDPAGRWVSFFLYFHLFPFSKLCYSTLICLLPSSYIVGMCGDGANDCGVSMDHTNWGCSSPLTLCQIMYFS